MGESVIPNVVREDETVSQSEVPTRFAITICNKDGAILENFVDEESSEENRFAFQVEQPT